MIVMARENGYWINVEKDTILWAKQNYIVFKLKDAINERIENHAENTNVERYKEDLEKIEKYVMEVNNNVWTKYHWYKRRFI